VIVTRDQVQADVRDGCDFVVVGSGAAGATAARVLTERGFDVVIVEEGPPVDRTVSAKGVFPTFTHYVRDAASQAALGRSFIPILQGRCVGGSTAINSAICWRTPEDAYDRCFRKHGLDKAVPIDALDRAFARIEEELHITEVREEILGRNSWLMREAGRLAGLEGRMIPRNEKDCEGSGNCLLACPTNRKQSTDQNYIPMSLAKGARLYATCRADRVTTRGGRADGLDGTFLDGYGRKGPRLRVEARRGVIVAGSAIHSPQLLQRSRLGNRRQVGAHFQAHPGTAMVGVFDDPVRPWSGATQGYEIDHYRKERMKLETIGLQPELAGVRLPYVGAELMRSLADFGHVAIWAVLCRANAEGSVGHLGPFGTRITYTPLPEDVAVIRRGLKLTGELMFSVGAKAVLPGIFGVPARITSPDGLKAIDEATLDPRAYHLIATHLFGPTRMSVDPRGGVVGPDFQVHGVPGLYVIDSSVFPTNLGVNPQHTIMGVAWVASERMATEAGR